MPRQVRLYRTRFPGQPVSLCGAPEGLVVPGDAHGVWAAVSVLLDQPLGVVAGDEGADSVTDLVDGPEDASVHDLLLQRAEEALDAAVRLGLADEGVARRHAPETGLLLEDVRHEVAAVVVAERQAAGGPGAEVAEPPAHRHADGLDRLEPGAALGHAPAEEFGVPMLGDAEQPDLAVPHGGDLGGVGRPHDVRRFRGDPALVRRLRPRAGPMRRQQGVPAHQAQDALARHPDAVDRAQPGPDLAVALAGPGRAPEVVLDGGEQRVVGHRRLRPAAHRLGGAARPWLASGVEAGARHRPDPADAGDAVAVTAGGGGLGAVPQTGHQRDLPRPKGPGRSILARSSSFSMLSSPMRCMAAASWPSAGSAPRSLSASSSAPSAFRRHCSSLNTGKPSSRESSSAASPRIRRSTASRLRAALQRWPGARRLSVAAPATAGVPWPGDSVDGLCPPSLTTGPSAASSRSLSFIRYFTMPVSGRTNGCPEKPGAAQFADGIAISSRRHRGLGFGRRCRRRRAMAGPNCDDQ